MSGPATLQVVKAICGVEEPALRPRRARRVCLSDGKGRFDEGMLVWMPGPRSYTGEDSAEVSCHGNPLLVERLVRACVDAGARPAHEGEFTRRAFLNGRLDLTRAEAVLQTIEARTAAGIDVARRGLDGEVQGWLAGIRERLLDLVAELEARLDFAEERPDVDVDLALERRIQAVATEVWGVLTTYRRGRIQVHGARVALVGPVNAGKSSLFNALLGRPRALVSPTPGTTRDVVESVFTLRGVEVTLLDTAGERDAPDEVEAAGLALRDELLSEVDLLVVVVPAHLPELNESSSILEKTRGRARVVVGSHADRSGAVPSLLGERLLLTSVVSGQGIDDLAQAIVSGLTGVEGGAHSVVIASERQYNLFLRVHRHLGLARDALTGEAGIVVAAEEMIAGIEAMDEIDGRSSREEVLDAVFSRFCLGK